MRCSTKGLWQKTLKDFLSDLTFPSPLSCWHSSRSCHQGALWEQLLLLQDVHHVLRAETHQQPIAIVAPQWAAGRLDGMWKKWVAVKEVKLNYHNSETIVSGIYPYYVNLNQVP